MIRKPLSELQRHAYSLLKHNREVTIEQLYMAVYGDAQDDLFRPLTNRTMQLKLAPMFKRINQKLAGEKIVPGDTKQTYKLTQD